MGIFEDYARKKDAERQEMRQSASDYFLDNEGTGLTDAAARAVGDAVSGVPGMFDAVGNFVGETYDTGGTNISDAAMALYNNPELRNKLSINSMVRDTTEAMGRAYENEYPNTVEGSDERYADYLASLGVFSGGALAGTKVLGDVVGAVNKGTPSTPGTSGDTLQNESRRKFGQDVGAAAVTAAVAPSLLGNFAKKAAVGTAVAGTATSLGASVAKLKSLSDKFEKAFDSYGDGDPQEVGDDMIDYHLNMYNAELMEERRKVLSEIVEDFGANNGANLPNLSNEDLMSLDGQMRYIDYDYLGERASDSNMDIEGNPMIDPSSNPQLAELRALIAKEKDRRGIKGVKVDNTSALLKDFFDSSEVEVPQDVIDRIREIEEQKKLGVLGQKSSMKMTDDGQGEFDFGEPDGKPVGKQLELDQAGREVKLQQQAMDDILRNADETTSVSEMERQLRRYEKSRLR